MNFFSRAMGFVRGHTSKDQRRFIKFIIVGASGVPVNLLTVAAATHVFTGLLHSNYRDTLAFLLGIIVSIFTNFLLNNAWTWGDRTAGDSRNFFSRLAKFYLVSSAAASVQFATSVCLSSLMRQSEVFGAFISGELRLYHIVAPLAGILLGLFINFTANHFWTFAKRR